MVRAGPDLQTERAFRTNTLGSCVECEFPEGFLLSEYLSLVNWDLFPLSDIISAL